MSLDSSDLELTVDGKPQTVGLRFRAVPLPPGAKLKQAYVQFEVDTPTSDPAALTLAVEAADDAAPFTAAAKNLSSRTRLGATIEWRPQSWSEEGEAGERQQTPDLRGLLEEIAARPGWKEGNALALFIAGSGKRVAKSFDGDEKAAPKLCFELAEGSVPDPVASARADPRIPTPCASTSSSPTPRSSPPSASSTSSSRAARCCAISTSAPSPAPRSAAS